MNNNKSGDSLSPNWAKFGAPFATAMCFGVAPHGVNAEVLVDLDATGLDEGPLDTWVNNGSVDGDFASAGDTVPEVITVEGVRTVALIGGTTGAAGTHYAGPIAPESVIDSDTSRTIEAWVYNPSPQDEETVFAWSRRGGPEGTNVSFGHATNGTYGALGLWGAPDIGWDGDIVFNEWTYIAYTYSADDTTTRVFRDGNLSAEEFLDGGLPGAFERDTNDEDLPFRVGRQSNADGTASDTGVGEIQIARIRVHDEALSQEDLRAKFLEERDAFGLGDADGDGIPDGVEENLAFLDPNNAEDGAADQDEDGLSNSDEYEAGTDMEDPDSDGDGALDGDEVNVAGTDPLNSDSDGDGLLDGVETNTGSFVDENDTGSDPLEIDSDGDGFPDGQEVSRGSDPTDSGSEPSLDDPVISLDATQLEPGEAPVWTNEGVLGGEFVASDIVPSVEEFQGIHGISFDGTNHFYTGPNTPASLTGNAARSIEAWVMNPALADEETIFAWGRRGGGAGTNMAFNHGANAAFGAIGHWGAPDIGWDGNITAGNWTYVVYTWDPENLTTTVYHDGEFAATETLPDPLNTWGVDSGGQPLPFRVASQNDAGGGPTGGLRGSMLIAKVRVHERALSEDEIEDTFEAESEQFGLGDADGDGLPAWFENQYAFLDDNDPDDADEDADEDGLSNEEEFELGGNPDNPDTDGDGALDGVEADLGSSLTLTDTDQDGLSDGVETFTEEFVDANDTGTDPSFDDTDLDGWFDGEEVFFGSDPLDGSSEPSFDEIVAIVDLNAANLDMGALESWQNEGAMGRSFDAVDGSAPEVVNAQGIPAVSFNGTSQHLVGPPSPIFFTGDFPRAIDAWVWNEEAQGEETVFSWGRRGGPAGSNVAFGHGTNPDWGAVGHWGEPDIGWDDDPEDDFNGVVTGAWTHIGYSYDPETFIVSVYRDGELANSEELFLELVTFAEDNTEDGNPLPFRVGAQNLASGAVDADPARLASLLIGRVRAYSQFLDADEFAAIYEAEQGDYEVTVAPGFSIAVASVDANGVTITWDAASGFTYAVDVSTDIGSADNWSEVASGLDTGSYTDSDLPDGDGARFYRVRAE